MFPVQFLVPGHRNLGYPSPCLWQSFKRQLTVYCLNSFTVNQRKWSTANLSSSQEVTDFELILVPSKTEQRKNEFPSDEEALPRSQRQVNNLLRVHSLFCFKLYFLKQTNKQESNLNKKKSSNNKTGHVTLMNDIIMPETFLSFLFF